MSKYKEENRQILKESIEVAPFTAKIQRTSEHGMERDRERCREPAFPVRVPALASPGSKTGHPHPHPHPHIIQSEKSNYYTTLSNSVVNEPPRLYPSKELSSYYEKVSAGAQAGALSLGGYSSKASLSKPPPLIKHQPEGVEGLAGKITEQLSQQATIVQQQQKHQHHSGLDRSSPTVPPSSTSFTAATTPNHHHHPHHHHHYQQQQLRAMPSLHRAPVFHPPTQHALERKEAAEREKERERIVYGGRLSPPTLTPIQPVSLASGGNKTLAEQQKPPTLIPELRDVTKVHGNAAIFSPIASPAGRDALTLPNEAIQEHRSAPRGKMQAAMASVIVRPSNSVKYDGGVGAAHNKEFPQGRYNSSSLHGVCDRTERIKEAGVSRIIQHNSNLDDIQNQKAFTRAIQGSPTSVCRTATTAPSAFGPHFKNSPSLSEAAYLVSGRGDFSPHRLGGYLVDYQDGSGSRTPGGGSLILPPPPSQAGTARPGLNLAPIPSPTTLSGPAISQPNTTNTAAATSFVHPKKHKAAMAAAQSRSNISVSPTTITTGNHQTAESADKMLLNNSPPPPPPPPSNSQASPFNADGRTTPGKCSPLPNGHASGSAPAGGGQPSNYHKLKKAWLTRHSEEDKNTSSTIISKPEKASSTATCTSSAAAVSEMIKPCTVNLSASTSSEVEMSKDIAGGGGGSRAERIRQSEEKLGGTEEKKAVHASRRGNKRSYESASESGGDDSDASETKIEGRAKRQPKPTYKKKQNDMAKKRGDSERDEDDVKPNGIFRSAREKTKLKLASSSKSY